MIILLTLQAHLQCLINYMLAYALVFRDENCMTATVARNQAKWGTNYQL